MINVQLCSIPSRESSLELTVNSLIGQVDRMRVMLNDYDHVPFFLNDHRKISVVRMSNEMADCNKAYSIEELEGYVLLVDDDIGFPHTYAQDMKSAIDKYKCIVSLHGRNWRRPFESFYRIEGNYRCLGNVPKDVEVECVGSGVCGWHTDFFKLKYADFKEANMSDIWLSKVAHEQHVKMMVLAHTENYLCHTRHKDTIFEQENRKGFIKQTEILKTFLT